MVFLFFFLACNSDKSESAQMEANEDNSTSDISEKDLVGSFVGMFGKNKITLLLTKVTEDSVVGRSVVAGNDRPFFGGFQKSEHAWNFTVKEPGSHRDDGMFSFTIEADNINNIKGVWQAYDLKRPQKKYSLQRRKFKYAPENGIYPEASMRLLLPEELENMPKEELELMRNAIFARHGYCFSRRHLREYFESSDWYVPHTTSVKINLTNVEKKNIALIKRYEAYADDYGDEYGR